MENESSSSFSDSSDSDNLSDSELETFAESFISCLKSLSNETKNTDKSAVSKRKKNLRSQQNLGKSPSSKLSSVDRSLAEEDAEEEDEEDEEEKDSPVTFDFVIDKKPEQSATSKKSSDDTEVTVFNLADMNFENSVTTGTAEETLELLNSDSSDDEVTFNFKAPLGEKVLNTVEEEHAESESDNSFSAVDKISDDDDGSDNDGDVQFSISRTGQNKNSLESKVNVKVGNDGSVKKKRKNRNKKNKEKKKVLGRLSSSLQTEDQAPLYLDVNTDDKKYKPNVKTLNQNNEPEVMKKSVIPDDIERMTVLPTSHDSLRKLKKQRKLEKEKTKGKRWFDMPAPEMTEQLKLDLEVLKMRKALDPKRFYKSDDRTGLPKYFQVGRVVETAADFYHSRVPKKQRKATLVEELLADAAFRKYNKRKFAEVQDSKRQGKGPYNQMKRLRKAKGK